MSREIKNKEKVRDSFMKMKDEVANETLTEQAYILLHHAILNLELQPGDSFLEREIADLLDMSRTPVRSSLIRLEGEGWLKIIPRKGFTVEKIDGNVIGDISKINEALDGLASELATVHMTKEDLDYLDELIDEQEKCMYDNNLERYVEIDHHFHNFITNKSYNDRLVKVIENQMDQLYRARLFTIDEREFPLQSINEHRSIVAAMRANHSQAARTLTEAHRQRGTIEITAILKEKQQAE